MANTDGPAWREIQSVTTAIEVIETLAELDGAGVTELATHLGLSKSTAHSYLATLTDADYLMKDGDEYRLTYQYLLLGECLRNNDPLYRFGRDKANELAQETGHYAHLYVEEKGLGVNIYEARGEHAGDYDYQSLKLQQHEPMHVTASGKAVLAHLPDERVEEIVANHGLEAYTENTITDEATLFDELATIRDRGYALNDEEEVGSFRAVAAPVLVSGGDILGSISVSGPKTFFDDKTFTEKLPPRVVELAEMIVVNVNMSL